MKLNCECVRDVLFHLEDLLICEEDNEGFSFESVALDTLIEKMPNKYSRTEILYTVYMLDDGDYIEAHFIDANSKMIDCIIHSMTNEGHSFADSLRSKKVFDKIKEILPIVSSATTIATAAFKLSMGIVTLL